MSQLTERREQGENTDEGKSGSGKDSFVDQALEAQSSSSSADLTMPRSGIKDMQDLKKDIVNVKAINEEHQKRISELEKKVNEAEQNTRKMNLWLYRLKEEEGENLKERVIDICRTVVPEAAGDFPLHIDTVYRAGKKKEGKDRPVVIRFIAKSTKDLLWKTSKRSEDNSSSFDYRFEEDLTAEEIETRNRLWPQVEAARKEGKKAFFAGASAIIDGKEISE